jgi:GST-like protein
MQVLPLIARPGEPLNPIFEILTGKRVDALLIQGSKFPDLFWQVGSTPYVGGGFAHFYKYAPVKIEYATDRYTMETKRQMDVLNRRLAGRAFILGDHISIADFAIFPWYGTYALGWYVDVREFLGFHEYPHLVRWAESMESRPAVQRGRRVNRIQKDVPGCIMERHEASDFENALMSVGSQI